MQNYHIFVSNVRNLMTTNVKFYIWNKCVDCEGCYITIFFFKGKQNI
jgi:hypothetical protein